MHFIEAATILYKENKRAGPWRLLRIDNGQIATVASLKTKRQMLRAAGDEHPLNSIHLGYDGMRILLTELQTLSKRGGKVLIYN